MPRLHIPLLHFLYMFYRLGELRKPSSV